MRRIEKIVKVISIKKITVLFISIVFAGLLYAQQQPKKQQAPEQVVIQLFDALSNRDSVSLKDKCTADVKFYEYGAMWTIDSLINLAITKNNAEGFKRTNRLDFVNTSINGNTAWTTYNLYSEITVNGKVVSIHWMETVVLVQKKRQWKVQLLHSTLIKRT